MNGDDLFSSVDSPPHLPLSAVNQPRRSLWHLLNCNQWAAHLAAATCHPSERESERGREDGKEAENVG